MKTKSSFALLAALLLGSALAGCAHQDHCCCPTSPLYGHSCFGYYGTCWRPWPGDCGRCPPYTDSYQDEWTQPPSPVFPSSGAGFPEMPHKSAPEAAGELIPESAPEPLL